MSYRVYALNLLQKISDGIDRERITGLGMEERKYLREVCNLALNDSPDPLGLARSRGVESTRRDKHWMAAEEVYRLHIDEGMSLRSASITVSDQLGYSFGDGGGSNVPENKFREHRAEIESSRLIYKALNEGRSLTEDEKKGLHSLSKKAWPKPPGRLKI